MYMARDARLNMSCTWGLGNKSACSVLLKSPNSGWNAWIIIITIIIIIIIIIIIWSMTMDETALGMECLYMHMTHTIARPAQPSR